MEMDKLVKKVLLGFAVALWVLLIGVQFNKAYSATPIQFQIFPGTNSNFSSNAPPAPAYTDALVLSADVEQVQVVPTGSKWVVFSGNCNFFAKAGTNSATTAVPSVSSTDGSAPQLNPSAWWLPGGTLQIAVIASATCIVTLSFYQ